MNEHAPTYTLPPADASLDALVGLPIEPEDTQDALPIAEVIEATVQSVGDQDLTLSAQGQTVLVALADARALGGPTPAKDRKSTRLNASHVASSYAGVCLRART